MRILAVVVLVALFIACSSSPSPRTLSLKTGDFTEDEWRDQVRLSLTQPGAAEMCRSIEGLSPAEVTRISDEQIRQGIWTPTQEGNASDRNRASEIQLEECARIE